MTNPTHAALEEFLERHFAADYAGLDDDMHEATTDWIDSLTPEEVGLLAQEHFAKMIEDPSYP